MDSGVIIQGSEFPAFKAGGEIDLLCGCGQKLISGYEQRKFIGIAIECFNCKTLTRTLLWPYGEALPQGLVVMDKGRRYMIEGPLDVTGLVGLISEQELARIINETHPVSSPPVLELTVEGLEKIIDYMRQLTAGDIDRALASATRAKMLGNSSYSGSPIAWALLHLNDRIVKDRLKADDPEDCAALGYVSAMLDLFPAWRHHPFYGHIAKGFVNEFAHTLVQFAAANYLLECGNNVGLTEPAANSLKSPDMYLNLNVLERCSVEIKAPLELQWPSEFPLGPRVGEIAKKILYKASKQLTGERGGVVVIGAIQIGREHYESFKNSVLDLLRRNQVSSKIAGVLILLIDLKPEFQIDGEDLISTMISCVELHRNPNFTGANYLKTV